MPRASHAPRAKRRVERIHSASTRRVMSAPTANANGHREQRVPRVQHRRVDHHARVAQERVEARPLERRDREHVERRLHEDEQAAEERAEAQQHRRRVRRDLAHAPAREEEHEARPDRQHEEPQEQRALLRGPRRGHLVEERRGRRRVRRDDREGEVRPQERDLQDREGRRRQARQRVHGAAARHHPVLPAAARAVDRRRDAVQGDGEAEDQAGASEGRHRRGLSSACRTGTSKGTSSRASRAARRSLRHRA